MSPPHNRVDAKALLAGIDDGLELAGQPDQAPGWQAVGLVLALQGGLALALSAYDTADPADVMDPSARGEDQRLAPVSLLLRRAGSQQHLGDPERLQLTRAQKSDIEALVTLRNQTLHPMQRVSSPPPETMERMITAAIGVLRHLLLDEPAFDPGRFEGPVLAIHQKLQLFR